jgi:hypothetical protein
MTQIKTTKNIKTIILTVIICCSLFVIYFFFLASRIQIEVYNKSNFDVDSLNIDNKFYSIPKHTSLAINCRRLIVQDNLPFGTPKGKIKNMRREKDFILFCGTGVEEISSGNYKFDLEVLTGKGTYMLMWKEHRN